MECVDFGEQPAFVNDSYKEVSTYSNKDSYMAIDYTSFDFEKQTLVEFDDL